MCFDLQANAPNVPTAIPGEGQPDLNKIHLPTDQYAEQPTTYAWNAHAQVTPVLQVKTARAWHSFVLCLCFSLLFVVIKNFAPLFGSIYVSMCRC